VHDIDIKPQGASAKGNSLVMTLTAKTYRYLEGNEGGAKSPKGRGRK
jgi:hypothetical protein